MADEKLHILPTALLDAFRSQVAAAYLNRYRELEDSGLSAEAFSFYTSVSAVFSSKIEGEDIELDSYVKHKRFGVEFRPDYTRKTDDLYNAYQFAKSAKCNAENIAEAHRMLTAHILPAHRQGKLRSGNMYVTTAAGSFTSNAPAGAFNDFGGNPVASFGWKFDADLPVPATPSTWGRVKSLYR